MTPAAPSLQLEPFWNRPCQWMEVALVARLTTLTTMVSPSLHTIMGPGNWPLMTIMGRNTPSGLAIRSVTTHSYSRVVAVALYCQSGSMM